MSHDKVREVLTRMRSEYTRAHPALPAKETLTEDAVELLAAIQLKIRATGPTSRLLHPTAFRYCITSKARVDDTATGYCRRLHFY